MDVRNIVVVQLDGPTELIASAQAIFGLKQRYPDSTVTLITSPQTYELSQFVPADHCVTPETFTNPQTDLVVNLGLSELSCSAASNVQAAARLGGYLGSDKQTCLDDGWSRFFTAIKHSSEPSDFHLVELLSSIAAVQWTDPDLLLNTATPAAETACKYIHKHEHIKVAVSLGVIPEHAIAKMVQVLYECGFLMHFYFVGTLKERSAAQKLISGLGDAAVACTNLAGKTSVAELVALHYVCDISIGSQGATAIASSGFGTLNLCYLNPEDQHFTEIPYGVGHLLFQPENDGLDDASLGELFAEILAFAVTKNDGSAPTINQWRNFFDDRISEYIGKLRVHISTLMTEASNEANKAVPALHPLLFSGYTSNDILRIFQRLSWESILNEVEINTPEVDLLEKTTLSELNTLVPSLEALVKACSFGIRYSNAIRECIETAKIETAQESGNKLQEVDDLIRSLSDSDSRLFSLIKYFFINQEQIFDIDPISVSKKILLCYTLLSHQAMLLLDLYRGLLGKLIDTSRPYTKEAEQNG